MHTAHNAQCSKSHACAQAAANSYIPRSAGANGASKWDDGKAGTVLVSRPASGAGAEMASPFEGMKMAGDAQKPDKAPEAVCGATLHLHCALWRRGIEYERSTLLAHDQSPRSPYLPMF